MILKLKSLTILLVGASRVIAPTACKRRKRPPPRESVSQADLATHSERVASMIQVADPRTKLHLTKGFHDVEHDAWRWTEGSFSAAVRPPMGAGQKGALLVLKFAIPDLVIQKLKSIRLSASVNGLALPPQEYTKPGDYTYSRDVPPAALAAPAVSVDFTLDKVLPPTPVDGRALGVVVSAIGFEAK